MHQMVKPSFSYCGVSPLAPHSWVFSPQYQLPWMNNFVKSMVSHRFNLEPHRQRLFADGKNRLRSSYDWNEYAFDHFEHTEQVLRAKVS